ncbi:MAG: hypothetical protein JOZ72_11635 [Alphaproteobacteria bacterium]|nr:hypothetical protein [Alphaproteobacteria bacterium]
MNARDAAASDAIGRDAALYPFALDPARDALMLVPMTLGDYRAASFLDERLGKRGPWTPAADVARAMTGARDVRPLHFIFHAGHVGSTLLSRLIDEADGVLPLREPLPLRVIAGQFSQARLELLLRLWERGFHDTRAVVLKATSATQRLATTLMAMRGGAKAVMLNVSAESYLAIMLAGENSATDLNAQGAERFHRLSALIGEAPPRPADLGELIAMSWLAERLTQLQAQRALGARVLAVDFDAMLAALPETLARVLAHLGIACAPERVAAIANGPTVTRYSKAPQNGYSPTFRAELLAESRRGYAKEIRASLDWLERLVVSRPSLAAVL